MGVGEQCGCLRELGFGIATRIAMSSPRRRTLSVHSDPIAKVSCSPPAEAACPLTVTSRIARQQASMFGGAARMHVFRDPEPNRRLAPC